MKCLLVSVQVVWCLLSKAQILAGQTGAGIYHTDVNPDTVVTAPMFGQKIYFLDIDNNGTSDFSFTTCNCSGSGGGSPYTYVMPLNNNECVFKEIDSCFGGPNNVYAGSSSMAKAFFEGDSIDSQEAWVDYNLYLSWAPWGVVTDSGQMYSYSCSRVEFAGDSLYLGVRVFEANDTLYGWVKLKQQAATGVTIQEFACTMDNIGIMESRVADVRVFPNPFSEAFTINCGEKNSVIEVWSTTGELILKQFADAGSKKIELRNVSPGIYTLVIKSEQILKVTRIVKL